MGLFDAVRSLLGRGDDGRGDAGGGGRGDSDGSGGPGGGDHPTGGGPSVQTHGSHWDTVVGGEDRETHIQRLVGAAVEEGTATTSKADSWVEGHLLGEGLAVQAVTMEDRVETAYPVVDGIEHAAAVEGFDEWASGIEAWVELEVAGATLTAFATDYFARQWNAVEDRPRASLAALMYNFGPADETVESDGEQLDLSGFAGLRPWDRGTVDDYVFRTVVEDVERVSLGRLGGYRIEAPLFRGPDADVDAAFFVGDHVAGEYDPEPGDSVEGAGWLQARLG